MVNIIEVITQFEKYVRGLYAILHNLVYLLLLRFRSREMEPTSVNTHEYIEILLTSAIDNISNDIDYAINTHNNCS